ncbi:tetratricopeptide repeat protein [Aestuariicoccus sp. MJ-SS9]|uniref:tetratricopeptide repeat protein n=1 Tax=Aestuariicoccus sp. MJ-SS9 TaxID=3079855 RepID=UPI00290FB036|nr:tetratricopeptide repeat protein [Aestuariicoccus sp. MJ-SS9]MDU8913638.1 winged helix-turn-helix domain-containing protein [Aestuariicoccus sp. MJ-SS9]
MDPKTSQVWSFGPFSLDERVFELRRNGRPVAIEPQSLRVLLFLIRERVRVVAKDDLIDAIWQGRAVSDWAISGAIKAVRVALGDTQKEKTLVKTVHGQGYRFIGEAIARSPAHALAPKPTVLVRVFRTDGPDAQHDYLAEGLTEDLIHGLYGNSGLNVLSYNTARALGADMPAPIYNVTHIVEGSLRQAGIKTRITINLLEAATGRQTWAERFDLTPASLMAGHDLIRDRLEAVLLPQQRPPERQGRGTLRSEAYDVYQKGRYAYFRYEPQAFIEALAHFTEATRLDPGFANAYAQQAYCRTTLHVFGLPGSDASLDPAEALARRAIACDEGAAPGYARLGWVLGYRGRPHETVEAFEAALLRDPDSPEVYLAFGETMNRLARPEEAGTLLDTVFSKDSYFPPSWEFPQGHRHLLLGNHDRAIRHFRSVLARVDRFMPARVQLLRALWETGDSEGAAQLLAETRALAPKFSLAHAQRMFPYPVASERQALAQALGGAGLQ